VSDHNDVGFGGASVIANRTLSETIPVVGIAAPTGKPWARNDANLRLGFQVSKVPGFSPTLRYPLVTP